MMGKKKPTMTYRGKKMFSVEHEQSDATLTIKVRYNQDDKQPDVPPGFLQQPRDFKQMPSRSSFEIGKMGEEWVSRMLQGALGRHTRLTNTSELAGEGDFRLDYEDVYVMIECKHSERSDLFLPVAFIEQSQRQLLKTRAHAGLLIYTGPAGSSPRVDGRLVIVGDAHVDGQVLAGVMKALTVAKVQMAVQSNFDQVAVSYVKQGLTGLCNVFGEHRRYLADLIAKAKTFQAVQREQLEQALEYFTWPCAASAALIPENVLKQLKVGREQLGKRLQKKRKRSS